MIIDLECVWCGKTFKGEEPLTCCSGRECGCMGLPVDGPVVCSNECYNELRDKVKSEISKRVK